MMAGIKEKHQTIAVLADAVCAAAFPTYPAAPIIAPESALASPVPSFPAKLGMVFIIPSIRMPVFHSP